MTTLLLILAYAAWFQILLWFAIEDDIAATIWGVGLAILAVGFVLWARWLDARHRGRTG